MGILVDPIECASHPTEEILEQYLFHRLSEALTAPLEEHLLVCHSCQDAVAEADEFIAAMRVLASQPAPQRAPWRSVVARLANPRSFAPIVALVMLALVLVWEQHPREASTPVAVNLSSLRGADPLAPAPVGKVLRLNLDLPDLAPGSEYRVEVVDATGRPVWKGTASDVNGKLAATMSKPLRNGVYWVRLYGTNSELLREFGISAK